MATTPAYCDVDFTTFATEFQNASCPNDNTSVVNNGTSLRPALSPSFNIIAALAVIGIAGVLSNIAVLGVLFKKENRKTPTNRFLINIAISDILMSSFISVRIMERLHLNIWSAASCQIYVIIRYLPLYLGINTIMLVSIERFVAIVLPMHFRAFVTSGRVKLQLAFTWFLTIVELIYPLTVVKEIITPKSTFCIVYYTRGDFLYMSLTAMILPAILLVTSYGGIIGVIVYSHLTVNSTIAPDPAGNAPTTLQNQQAARRQKRAIRVAATCAVVTFLFLACWTPVWVSTFLFIFKIGKADNDFYNGTIVILCLHPCMNPVVYFITDERFRSVFLRLLCRKDVVSTTNVYNTTAVWSVTTPPSYTEGTRYYSQ